MLLISHLTLSKGVCREILIGLETSTTPNWFNSLLTQNEFSIYKIQVITEVDTHLFPIDLKCLQYFQQKKVARKTNKMDSNF